MLGAAALVATGLFFGGALPAQASTVRLDRPLPYSDCTITKKTLSSAPPAGSQRAPVPVMYWDAWVKNYGTKDGNCKVIVKLGIDSTCKTVKKGQTLHFSGSALVGGGATSVKKC